MNEKIRKNIEARLSRLAKYLEDAGTGYRIETVVIVPAAGTTASNLSASSTSSWVCKPCTNAPGVCCGPS
jgi:hypothetical protein